MLKKWPKQSELALCAKKEAKIKFKTRWMKCWNCWTSIATRSHPHLSGQAPHHLPPAPSSPFSLLPLLFCMLHPARTPAAAAAALYCRLPLGLRSCCTLFQSVNPLPLPLCYFFYEWLVFAMYHVCLSVCVCESRFCVQVRSFNFDLCFRLFCVAFVDFCHLNRNFYFPHVSRHAQTPQQQQEEQQEQQPSPVFVLPVLFFSALFLWTHVLRGALATGNWRARLANWISFLPDQHLKLTSSQPGLVRVWVVWPALLLLLATHAIIRAEI